MGELPGQEEYHWELVRSPLQRGGTWDVGDRSPHVLATILLTIYFSQNLISHSTSLSPSSLQSFLLSIQGFCAISLVRKESELIKWFTQRCLPLLGVYTFLTNAQGRSFDKLQVMIHRWWNFSFLVSFSGLPYLCLLPPLDFMSINEHCSAPHSTLWSRCLSLAPSGAWWRNVDGLPNPSLALENQLRLHALLLVGE